MADTVAVARERLKNYRPDSKIWAAHIDRLADAQVVVMYMRFKLQGKLK